MVLKFTENTGSDNPLNSVDLDDYINPTLVDIDNDNDFDVIAGSLDTFDGKGGTYEGDAVYYYENTGNINNASFASEDKTTYDSLNLAGSTPTFVDIDNDGDFDTFLGASDGTVTYFKNTGSQTSATFTQQDDNVFDTATDSISNAAPAFVDTDNDGDLDAYVGRGDGIVGYYENIGSASNPTFSIVSIPFSTDSNSNPTLVDVDGDGDFDAFVGSGDGTVSYYENTGNASSATFTKRTGTNNPFNGIDFGDDSSPVFADIDNDGDDDAFVGSSNGTIRYFENITTVSIATVTSSTAEIDETIDANHAQFTISINKANHGGLDLDFSVNSNVQRGVSTASQFGDDYRLYYLDSSSNKQYINGDSFYIEDGTDELTVYVEPIDDYIYESDETITINLESSEDYDLEGNDSVSITITDNEPTVSVSDYSTTIYETTSDFGDAVSFDGVDDYVELIDQSVASTFDSGSTAFTITGWLKPSTLSSDTTNHNIENVFLARASDAENDNFELGITTDGKLNLYLDTNSGDSTIELGNGELTTEEWHSFALTFDSGSVTAYIDGNEYTSSVNGTQLDEADGSPFTLGKSLHIDTFYNGAIDELGIWDTALTKDEIENVRYTTLDGDENNLVTHYSFDQDSVDDNTITDLTANANDGTLNNGDGDNFDTSLSFIGHIDLELDNEVTNEPGITVNYQIDSDSTATQGVDFYSSEVDVSTTDGVDPVNSVFIPQGEDSGRIYLAALPDAVAEGDEEINLNLVADFNQAISLDGSDDYVDLGNPSELQITGNQTIEMWLKPANFDNRQNPYAKAYGGEGTITLETSGKLNYYYGTAGKNSSTYQGVGSDQSLELNEWSHVAVVRDFDSDTVTWYINGEQTNQIATNHDAAVAGSLSAYIGKGYKENFAGEIDEFRMWSTARSEDEIKDNLNKSLTGDEDNLAAYYNFNSDSVDGETIGDTTDNANDGTLITNNEVLSVDGSNYISVPSDSSLDLSTTGEFTQEAWIYSTIDDNSYHGFLGSQPGATSTRYPGMWIRNQTGIHFGFGDGSNWNNDTVYNAIAANEWNHVATTFDGTSYKLYVNGEEIYSTDNFAGRVPDSTQQFDIGRVYNNNFEGKIDEVRMWNKARSASEIKSNLNTRIDSDENGLVAYYSFDDSTANDRTSNGNDGSSVNSPTFINDTELVISNVIDSFASDPFAAGGATYNIDGSTSASIEIQDSGSYTPGVVIVDEFGDEVTSDNPLVEDANGDVTFSVKLTSEPTENVALTVDSSNNSFSTDTWDEWQEFTVPAATAISVTSNDADYSSLTPAIYTIDSSDTVKLRIEENGTVLAETILPIVEITDSSNAFPDESQAGEINIGLSQAASEDLSIPFSVSGNSNLTISSDELESLSSIDSNNQQGILNIPAGTTSATISIAGVTDNSDDGDEEVTVSLQSGDDYNLDLNNDEATIKVDYENPDVEFARFSTLNNLELSDEAASLLDIDVVEHAEEDSGQKISTLNVALSQQPTADVTVSLDDTNNTTLTFTADNWNESQQVTVTNEVNRTLSLDGVNDYIDFENTLAVGSTYTMEGWFNSSNGSTQDLIALTEGESNSHYALVELQSNGQLRFLHRSPAGTGGGTNIYSGSDYNDGQWHHVAAVKNASGLTLYVDGIQEGTATDSSAIEDNVDLTIGQISPVNSARSFSGKLDEIRIWNTARTETEVQDNLNVTLDGDESGLVGYWNFDSDTNDSTDILDLSGSGNEGTLINGNGDNIFADLQVTTSSTDSTFSDQTFDLPISSTVVNISFDPSDPDSVLTTSEAGDSAEFGVRLATAPDGDVVIDLSIPDATEGQLAADSPTQLIFNSDNWDTYQTVTVEGIDDTDYDSDIKHKVELEINDSTTASNYSNVTIDSVTIINQDDETEIEIGETSETGIINNLSNVYASLSVDSSEITEGETAQFTVNLSEAVTEDTVVKYEIIDGSATAGDDYTALTGEVTVANGESSATIDLASIDDVIDEDSENVEIRLLAPSNNVDLKVTTAYDGNSIYLQLNSGDDIQISPGDELVFDGAVATVNSDIDAPITLSSTTPTEVPVILDTATSSIEVDETTTIIIPETTFDLSVATAYDSTTGTVGLQLDSDGTEFSINPGDQIVFSHGTEDDTTVTVTVDGSNAIALTNGQEVSVRVTLNDGATVLDTNYTSPVYQEDYILDEAAENYSVNLNINDNDTANVLITDDAARTNEIISLTTDEATGTAETFYVQLDSKPTEPVAVYFGSNDTEEGLLSDSDQTSEETVKLAFSASNWDVAQEVSINPVDDDVDETGDDNNYQIISTVISDDVKYNEDNVLLKVNSDFDASTSTLISLAIDELSINNTELLAGTQLSFANGMVLEVDSDTKLTNSDYTDVSVSLVTEANQILADSTAYIDDDSDNTTPYTNLVVTEAYKEAGVDETTGLEISGGTVELQLDTSGDVSSLNLIAGEQLSFSNGAVFTLDADVTLNDTDSTVVSGTIDSNLLKVTVTEVSTNATADVNTDVTDLTSGETEVIVTSDYDAAAGTISIQINDASASSLEIPAGTQLNFSNGGAVILDETVTISDTASTVINVSGVDHQITTTYGESISTDITVTNTDDDIVGVTVTASDTSATEGLGNNFFSVQLDSKPVGEVEVSLHPSNDDIQLDDEFDGEAATLTFDVDNWSIPQNVNVTAVDDYYVEYDHSSTISTTVSSSEDDIYDQVAPPNDIEIKITDNDLPIASIEAITGASEAGAPGYFIVELDNAAPDGVDGTGIVVNYSVTGGTADADGDESNETDDLQPLSGSVRIAPGETRSPVIAFPTDDFKVEAVPLIVEGNDSLSGDGTIQLAINTENISSTLLETIKTEGLTIADGTELTFDDGAVVTVDGSTNLTIDSSDSGVYQDINVVFNTDSPKNAIASSETTSIPEETVIVSLSTGDDYYIDLDPDNAPSATLSIQDNDKPGLRIVEAGDRTIVNEDGTAEYYVSLLSQPEGDVTVSMTGEDTIQTLEVVSVDSNGYDIGLKLANSTDVTSLLLEAGNYSIGGNNVTINAHTVITDTAATVTLNDNSAIAVGNTLDYTYSELGFANGSDELTFSSDNWYELQTVTLKGLDDNVVESPETDYHTSRVLYEVTSTDTNYNGFEVSPQTVNIIDRIFDKDNTTESLTEGFLGLQDAIDSISLPIIGNLSSVSPSFLEDFLDNLIDEVKNTEDVTADSLSDSFDAAFATTIDESGFTDDLFNLGVEITDLSSENIEFILNIAGEVGQSFPLDTDLGLSALGISLETNGNLNADFGYGIDLAFGINKDDGFYLNTDDTAFELDAGLSLGNESAENTEEFGITGKLGFLQLDINDGIGNYDIDGNKVVEGGYDADGNEDVDGTNVAAEFTATLQDNNDTNDDDTQLTLTELNAARKGDIGELIQYGFSGDAALDIDVTTSFEGDTSFPSLGFNLYSEMPIFNYDNAEDEEELSGATLEIDESNSSSDASGNITIAENNASATTLAITATGTDSDIKLNKGTELTFNNEKVVVTKNAIVTPTGDSDSTPTIENISVEVADDKDSTTNQSVTLKEGETAELVSGDFNIAFNDITLDLGEFVSDTVSPVIGFVEELIEPFEPIIDVLQTEIELLDSLGLVDTFDENDDGAATLIEVASTLATLYSGGETNLKYQQFFDAVTGIIELVETIEDLGNLDDQTIEIEFGDYVLQSFSGASDNEDASSIDTESKGDDTALKDDTSTKAKTDSKVGNFFNKLDELGIGIPLLEDPFTAINLLLGQDVDLITYDIPELDIEFGIEQEFPIFGSIKGLLEGGFSLYSDLVVGYDTNGINQWEETDFELAESYKILDGFYLSDLDPDTGEDVDELTMDATIAAGVSASAVVAKAEVKGGVTGTAALDITDGGELTGTSDGKLRGSEVLDADSLLDLFTLSGALEAFLEASVKVGVDLGFYEIMKTVWSERFSTTLFEFELGSSGGSASQYYIEGATVFFDANLNGEHEEGEPTAVTDVYGRYNLDVPLLFFDTNDNGEIDSEEGQIVSMGGIDTSSGLEVETPLVAPYGSKMLTPLSTIKQNLIEEGVTPEEAEAQIETALDLPDVDLDNFDPIKAIANGDERGAAIYQAHNEVQNLFIQGTEFVASLEESDFNPERPLNPQVIKEISQGIVKPGTAVDLANQEDLERVFTPLSKKIKLPGDRPNAPSDTERPGDNETFTAFTEAVAWGNQSIDEAFANAPLDSVVEDTATTKQIVHGQLKHLQGQLGRGELSPAQLSNQLGDASATQPFPGLPPLPTLPSISLNPSSSGDLPPGLLIDGDNTAEELIGDRRNDTINGNAGFDTLIGGAGNDKLRGNVGNDKLRGNAGDDTLSGGQHLDILNGGDGDDILAGNQGTNVLIGGKGSDLFYLENYRGTDWIRDFEPELDRIGLANGIDYDALEITGNINSFIFEQGDRIAVLNGVSPTALSRSNFSQF